MSTNYSDLYLGTGEGGGWSMSSGMDMNAPGAPRNPAMVVPGSDPNAFVPQYPTMIRPDNERFTNIYSSGGQFMPLQGPPQNVAPNFQGWGSSQPQTQNFPPPSQQLADRQMFSAYQRVPFTQSQYSYGMPSDETQIRQMGVPSAFQYRTDYSSFSQPGSSLHSQYYPVSAAYRSPYSGMEQSPIQQRLNPAIQRFPGPSQPVSIGPPPQYQVQQMPNAHPQRTPPAMLSPGASRMNSPPASAMMSPQHAVVTPQTPSQLMISQQQVMMTPGSMSTPQRPMMTPPHPSPSALKGEPQPYMYQWQPSGSFSQQNMHQNILTQNAAQPLPDFVLQNPPSAMLAEQIQPQTSNFGPMQPSPHHSQPQSDFVSSQNFAAQTFSTSFTTPVTPQQSSGSNPPGLNPPTSYVSPQSSIPVPSLSSVSAPPDTSLVSTGAAQGVSTAPAPVLSSAFQPVSSSSVQPSSPLNPNLVSQPMSSLQKLEQLLPPPVVSDANSTQALRTESSLEVTQFEQCTTTSIAQKADALVTSPQVETASSVVTESVTAMPPNFEAQCSSGMLLTTTAQSAAASTVFVTKYVPIQPAPPPVTVVYTTLNGVSSVVNQKQTNVMSPAGQQGSVTSSVGLLPASNVPQGVPQPQRVLAPDAQQPYFARPQMPLVREPAFASPVANRQPIPSQRLPVSAQKTGQTPTEVFMPPGFLPPDSLRPPASSGQPLPYQPSGRFVCPPNFVPPQLRPQLDAVSQEIDFLKHRIQQLSSSVSADPQSGVIMSQMQARLGFLQSQLGSQVPSDGIQMGPSSTSYVTAHPPPFSL